ncbi:hypothetical protein DPMN_187651 [Dreissena polymorpha]|uniref:Uncharacterized protein n=1 Tax=Dreissena polymorpha TaxID=45954 RepID=A0A9D4DS08_DREPO|nr:hypothetical protein DPMN_187651 [Dreissena polymorpha]
MVPGRNACYPGWTQEYAEYLMAETYGGASNKDFICVDGEVEMTNCNSALGEGGANLYHVENACDSLKCPPYISGCELTCAVCSHRR